VKHRRGVCGVVLRPASKALFGEESTP